MTARGAYRLGLYCLLHTHPLVRYAREGVLRVLIDCEDPLWRQAFRTVFWAGQLPDATLEITLCGAQAGAARASLDDPALPELLEKGYAALRAERAPVDAVYDAVFSPALALFLRPGGLLAVPGAEDEAHLPQLLREAKNCDYAYAMTYDQRCNRAEQFAAFDAMMAREFDSDDGASYNADSSLAAAVFFSVHFALCGDLAALSQTIAERNERYQQMLALEHRRWVAYMAMRGYRAPRWETGEWDFVYDGEHTHKHEGKKLHVGMCGAGQAGLNPAMRTAAFWENDPDPALPELDLASWRCHRIAAEKAASIRPEDLTAQFPFLNEPALEPLRRAVSALLRDAPNAPAVYDAALRRARAMGTPADLRALEKALQCAYVRDQRINFFAFDANMIDMIPFCHWYGRCWDTVFTYTDGLPVEDVVIPTLLCAREAVFVGNVDDAHYQSAVCHYFRVRGGTTEPRFIPCDLTNLPAAFAVLSRELERLGGDEDRLVLHQVQSQTAAIPFGMAIGAHPRLAAVRYDRNTRRIVSANGYGKRLTAGLCSKSFSVAEYIALMGGRAAADSSLLRSGSESDALTEVFWRAFASDGGKALRALASALQTQRGYPIKRAAPSALTAQLMQTGVILPEQETADAVSFRVCSAETASLLEEPGKLFERMVFTALRDSGVFDDVQTGVHIAWGGAGRPTQNEIDVIAVRGMTALFFSCKTNQKITRDYLYEIDAVSAHFRAYGVLCCPWEAERLDAPLRTRAESQRVSILCRETLSAPIQTVVERLEQIVSGETVIG